MNRLPIDEDGNKNGPSNSYLNEATWRIAHVLKLGRRDRRDANKFRESIEQVPPGSNYIIEFKQESWVNIGGQTTVTRNRGIVWEERNKE